MKTEKETTDIINRVLDVFVASGCNPVECITILEICKSEILVSTMKKKIRDEKEENINNLKIPLN